jgi:16S rRNA (guanine527-N7)-methyltransferase
MQTQVAAYLQALDIEVSVEEWACIRRFYDLLMVANQKVNLTRITAHDDFLVKHIADSLLALAAFPELRSSQLAIADVGCGAGIPGIPLAIVCPQSSFVEIDSVGKKVRCVSELIEQLALENCRAHQERSCEMAHRAEHIGRYDVILGRAIGDTAKLIDECQAMLCGGGRFLSFKTPAQIITERPTTERQARRYGLKVTTSQVYELPGGAGSRQLWIVTNVG